MSNNVIHLFGNVDDEENRSNIVTALEHMLQMAKDGKIDAFAAVATSPDHGVITGMIPGMKLYALIGGVAFLQHSICSGVERY